MLKSSSGCDVECLFFVPGSVVKIRNFFFPSSIIYFPINAVESSGVGSFEANDGFLHCLEVINISFFVTSLILEMGFSLNSFQGWTQRVSCSLLSVFLNA